MKIFVVTGGVITLFASHAFAQTPDPVAPSDRSAVEEVNLATPTGHEVSAGFASYTYREPGAHAISIHGARFVGDYTGTLSLNKQRQWFAQGQVRGTLGNVGYDGWCSPFLITPDNASPNGYALDVGDPSRCSESGDKDGYLEARGLTRKDLIGHGWGWSPYTGLGFRHLSNGTTGIKGFRTDEYLYLPVGLTARTNMSSRHALAVNLEVDPLLRGWQKTRNSALGGGDIPATPIAPAFTINGLSDVSFSQRRGFAFRASAKYQLVRAWSIEPYFVYWRVNASPVSDITATFTVNRITAREQLGALEPLNATRELGVKFGVHF